MGSTADNKIVIYTLSEKSGKLSHELLCKWASKHKQPINSIGVADGKFILTCSGKDTVVSLWGFDGRELQTFTTKRMHNYMAEISPDGKSFAVASFTGVAVSQ